MLSILSIEQNNYSGICNYPEVVWEENDVDVSISTSSVQQPSFTTPVEVEEQPTPIQVKPTPHYVEEVEHKTVMSGKSKKKVKPTNRGTRGKRVGSLSDLDELNLITGI